MGLRVRLGEGRKRIMNAWLRYLDCRIFGADEIWGLVGMNRRNLQSGNRLWELEIALPRCLFGRLEVFFRHA
jgi:hypothetical protein